MVFEQNSKNKISLLNQVNNYNLNSKMLSNYKNCKQKNGKRKDFELSKSFFSFKKVQVVVIKYGAIVPQLNRKYTLHISVQSRSWQTSSHN